MPFVTHNNGKLFVESIGSGDPIVFVHGFALDHTMWKPQVDTLCKHYRCITYDLRGHGDSSVPTGPYSHHDDLYAVLASLGIKQAHVVGLSLGGEIAIDFTLTHPDQVQSLTLMDSSLGGYASTVDWNVHALQFGLDVAKKNWIGHNVFAITRKNPRAIHAVKRMVEHYSGWLWFHTDIREKLHPSAMSRLKEIAVPTQILLGERDIPYFHTIADILEREIPHMRKITISHAGHMVNLEKPHDVNDILEKFIRVEAESV